MGPGSLTAIFNNNSSPDPNFAPSTSPAQSFTVNPAPLVATVQPTTKVYGVANPTFTLVYSGFVNGDTASVITGAATFTMTATAASGAGAYPVTATAGTLAATNYTFTFVAGTLTVTAAPLTATIQSATKIYGASNPPLTLSYSGFVNGDTSSVLTGAATLTTTATAASGVGTYPITAALGTLAATNYTITISSNAANLTVTPAALTGTVQPATKVYGAALPGFALSYAGFVNGDTSAVVSGTASFTTNAATTSPVGSYSISAAIGTLTAANYAITISPTAGTLTITTAALIGTVQNATKVYGTANPAFAVTYTGFVNGDTASVVTGAAAFTTTATATSAVGTYPVTATTGTLTAANYTITISTAGTLTVTGAPLIATVQSATKVYGAANPGFALSYSGFVNGDTSSVVTGTATFTTTATAASGVGSYSVTATAGTLSATNYTITFVAGTLTVTAAPLTGTVQNATRVYGGSDPTFAVTYSGFVNGNTASVVSGLAAFTTNASATSPVGTYSLSATIGTLTAANYAITISSAAATYTITAATLTGTVQNATRVYAAANPTFAVTYSGFANSQTASVISGSAAVSTTATTASPVAIHPIAATLGTLVAPNYSFTFMPWHPQHHPSHAGNYLECAGGDHLWHRTQQHPTRRHRECAGDVCLQSGGWNHPRRRKRYAVGDLHPNRHHRLQQCHRDGHPGGRRVHFDYDRGWDHQSDRSGRGGGEFQFYRVPSRIS